MSDNVNKPSHYTSGDVECIDGIRAALSESFADYCRGNVLKYVWRCGKKGDALEDLRKAAKYLQWAIEAMESNASKVPNSSAGKTLAIPEGWRELHEGEKRLKTDLYSYQGKWCTYIDFDPAGSEMTGYDKGIHYKHIRKIETENASEKPAEWIPKVGDKVRVVKPLKTNIKHPHWAPEMDEWNGRFGIVSKSDLELRIALIDGFQDRDGYGWRFSFDWLRYEGSTSEAAQ